MRLLRSAGGAGQICIPDYGWCWAGWDLVRVGGRNLLQ